MKSNELIAGGIIVIVFSAYMFTTYKPRIEERIIRDEPKRFEIQDSQRYIWSIESLERGDYWETDTEPWVADGFLCFIYGVHEAEVCVPVGDTRYYKQAER
jgi:hypothetical protein